MDLGSRIKMVANGERKRGIIQHGLRVLAEGAIVMGNKVRVG